MKKGKKDVWKYLLIASFILLMVSSAIMAFAIIFPDFVGSMFRIIFLPTLFSIPIFGAALVIFSIKVKLQKWLRIFLIITGASPAGFAIFSILHNMFYAFTILSESIVWLSFIMEILHVAFFLISIFVCPIVFIIGLIGTIVLFIRNKCQLS